MPVGISRDFVCWSQSEAVYWKRRHGSILWCRPEIVRQTRLTARSLPGGAGTGNGIPGGGGERNLACTSWRIFRLYVVWNLWLYFLRNSTFTSWGIWQTRREEFETCVRRNLACTSLENSLYVLVNHCPIQHKDFGPYILRNLTKTSWGFWHVRPEEFDLNTLRNLWPIPLEKFGPYVQKNSACMSLWTWQYVLRNLTCTSWGICPIRPEEFDLYVFRNLTYTFWGF